MVYQHDEDPAHAAIRKAPLHPAVLDAVEDLLNYNMPHERRDFRENGAPHVYQSLCFLQTWLTLHRAPSSQAATNTGAGGLAGAEDTMNDLACTVAGLPDHAAGQLSSAVTQLTEDAFPDLAASILSAVHAALTTYAVYVELTVTGSADGAELAAAREAASAAAREVTRLLTVA